MYYTRCKIMWYDNTVITCNTDNFCAYSTLNSSVFWCFTYTWSGHFERSMYSFTGSSFNTSLTMETTFTEASVVTCSLQQWLENRKIRVHICLWLGPNKGHTNCSPAEHATISDAGHYFSISFCTWMRYDNRDITGNTATRLLH